MAPRFKITEINPNLLQGDIGDAFQRFVFDLLRPEYQARGFNLNLYQGNGKDGGIDLAATLEDRSEWLECKVCGKDSPAMVRRVWEDIADKLRRNLAHRDGPPPGQSQYAPWYRQTPKIEKYIYCTTAKMGNEGKSGDLRKLKADIQSFFQRLSADYAHLSHLHDIQVEVLDWFDFERRLLDRKHLLFRWFPQDRLPGLLPFEEVVDSPESYRAYLYAGRLPYYSRADYAKINQPPLGVPVESESELLSRLAPLANSGIIVTGPGGVGKTRLTFELARTALQEDWVVFRAGPKLTAEQLIELSRRLDHADQVLIVFDYVEIQGDFVGLIEAIEDINDASGLHLRYVASSRSAFYRSTLAAEGGHHHVDLSPLTYDAARSWLEGYFEAAVQHILNMGLGAARPEHLTVCGRTPALAVFLAYLKATGRGQELEALTQEQDFPRWVLRRLQMTFGTHDVTQDLASLAAMLPAPEGLIVHLKGARPQIFDRLVEDGWVERHDLGSGPVYAAIHDVLADQIFLHHLAGAPATRATFLEALVDDAICFGTLDSLLITLQRVSDASALVGINLFDIIVRSMGAQEDAWGPVALPLLRLSLLTTAEKLSLHQQFPRVWAEWENSVKLHNLLGWLARQVVRGAGGPLSEGLHGYLIGWLEVVSSHIDRSNYILNWGLRLAPERLQDPALSWITSKAKLFQTHYLLVAWLEMKLSTAAIREPLRSWLERHATTGKASFVYWAWLNAIKDQDKTTKDRDSQIVRDYIRSWLQLHHTEEYASFVYTAWLNATQDPEPVRDYIQAWLQLHHTGKDAGFVYTAWLNAIKDQDKTTKDRDSQIVRDYIRAWLQLHHSEEDAGFVYTAVLNTTQDPEPVRDYIQAWLQLHHTEEDACFVYMAWLDATKDRETELVENCLWDWLHKYYAKEEARFVYKAWLNATQDPEPVRDYIQAWLQVHHIEEDANLVYHAWLDATKGKELALVENCICDWLQKHYATRVAGFVYRAWLEATKDPEPFWDYIQGWLQLHQTIEEAGFIYRGWLDALQDSEPVREYIRAWLQLHHSKEDAQFVYRAWLDSTKDPSLVEDCIWDWLQKHYTTMVANFVYRAWIEATNDPEPIKEYLSEWLLLWPDYDEIDFVMRAWMNAGGEFEVIKEPALRWLHQHATEARAGFLMKNVAQLRDLPVESVLDVLNWCNTFPQDEDALWRYCYLSSNLNKVEDIFLLVTTVENLVGCKLSAGTLNPPTCLNISTTLCFLIVHPGAREGTLRTRVDDLFLRWLRHPFSFGASMRKHRFIQHIGLLIRVMELLANGQMEVHADRETIERFLDWVETWYPNKKARLGNLLKLAAKKFPAPGLWDRVKM